MSEKIFEIFEENLQRLKETNLYRSVKDVEAVKDMKIIIEGREYINFASNDYLGLSRHPAVKEASIEATKIFGTGAGASRLLCGGTVLHKKLEELLCEFKETEACVLLNSGYTANISLIPALTDENDIILSDELNHASIIDGCKLSRARKIIYKHADIEEIKKLVKITPCKGKKIIISDTVFSMDGDIAPLKEIFEICKSENALLYIDDAHGTGVLGEGYGALKYFKLKPENFVIQMGTLSKAIGSFGAFLCGAKTLIEWFVNSARGFIFSTALPAGVVASAYASLKIIMKDKNLIKKLWYNTEKVMNTVKSLGFKTTETQTPIIPVIFENIKTAMKASKILSDTGIYAPVIRPPTVKTPRIRISVSAAHSEEDIERLKEALICLHQQFRQV